MHWVWMILALGGLVASLRLAFRGRSMAADGVPGGSTRLVGGLAAAVVCYHAMAWTSPAGWFAIAVGVDRWWLVAGGAVLAIGGAVLADRLERGGEAE